MVVLVAGGPLAVEAVGAYLLTYVVTSIGAFGVVTLSSSPMGERDADAIYDYHGLFWRRPYLASILTALLLSLAGIPLTAGFIGKRSEEHTSALQSLMRLSYAVFCLKKQNTIPHTTHAHLT